MTARPGFPSIRPLYATVSKSSAISRARTPEDLGHPLVLSTRPAVTLVGQQQDAGTGDGSGRPAAGPDERLQLLPLGRGEGDDVLLCRHGRSPSGGAWRGRAEQR